MLAAGRWQRSIAVGQGLSWQHVSRCDALPVRVLAHTVVFCMTFLGVTAGADDGLPSDPHQTAFAETIAPFLGTYCGSCHGAKEQKGDRRFDQLAARIDGDATLVDYQDIVDQLNLGEMPPREAAQPSDEQRQKIVQLLSARVQQYHAAGNSSGGATVLRRLNAREYRNTIRDLLRLNMTMFDPTHKFPRDQTSQHLDNVGQTLVTSGHLLARYLEAADQVVNKSLFPIQQPHAETWSFRDDFRQQPEIDQVHKKTNRFDHITLYDVVGADKHEGAYGPILALADGVPHDGMYEIRFQAEAVNRLHPYDPKFLGTDPSEPLRLGIVAGNRAAGSLHLPQPVEPLLAEIELADRPKWYTQRIWLDAGFTPRFTFRNGLMDVRNLWARLIRKYPDQFPENASQGIVSARFNAIKHGKLPQIRIHQVEIRGPLHDQWPTASQRALLGDDWDGRSLSMDRMNKQVREFATRAYRREVTDQEVERIIKVIELRQAGGKSPTEAFGDGIKAILCSPHFLYLEEPDQPDLSSHALASRLSYFLWSSMPDRELMQLADTDEINSPAVLRQQTRRMLDDPRSDALVQGFLGSWLGLRQLGATPPDRSDFREFYHYDLDTAMRRETFLFIRHLLDQNLPAINFLDSDFTFVNKPLARLYGLQPPKGYEFERVTLPSRRRGGLLGQSSILTLTANGIDTSPVIRGVWLLDHLLGTPPSPPPPDVEPLDPDTRGATTIRDQLDRHRSVAACNECHRKIDPPGFALENFDPIGRWRDTYRGRTRVDASGQLADGQSFEDIEGLKAILVKDPTLLVRALTTKLLAYAMGRHTKPSDRPHVDAILAATRGNGYRMGDLIEQVVLCSPFRRK